MSDEFQNLPTEEWRPVPGHDGIDVSNLGRLRSWRAKTRINGKFVGGVRKNVPTLLTLTESKYCETTYLMTGFTCNGKTKTFRVHNLVAAAFHGPAPDGMEVRHLNGNGSDNRSDNLKYGTRLENVHDKFLHGKVPDGKEGRNGKLPSWVVEAIVRAVICGEVFDRAELARSLNVGWMAISSICGRKSWGKIWIKVEAEINGGIHV